MKNPVFAIAAAALVAGSVGSASAQSYHRNGGDHGGWARDRGQSHHWNRGEHMGYDDWSNAQAVDYRHHHIRRPPRGYEWRESDGQFILAAVATGVVASIILDHNR
jgi:Ni/Co efflux regulator RcnB